MSYHIQNTRWETISTNADEAPELPPTDYLILTDAEKETIADLAPYLLGYNASTDPEGFIMEAQVRASALPERLRRALLAFRRFGSCSGGFLIRGLPIGEVPKTPLDANHTLGAATLGARGMALILGLIGEQIGYLPELGGKIFQNISPMQGREDTQQSVSSRVALLIHTETAFTENRSDLVALLCLRPDHFGHAGTLLSSATAIASQLTEREIQVLRGRRWATRVDESFLLGAKIGGEVLVGPISILSGSDLRPKFRCDFNETRPLEPSDLEARRVLRRLEEVVGTYAITIQLRESDLLLVDNHAAFHGRTNFVPRFDGWDRWLLRSFAVKDLSRSVADRPGDGRIVDRDYTVGAEVLYSEKISA